MQASACMILCFHWGSILSENVGESGQKLEDYPAWSSCMDSQPDTFIFNARDLKLAFTFDTRAQLLKIT